MEAAKRPDLGTEIAALSLKHLPDRLVGLFQVAMGLGIDDELIERPDYPGIINCSG